MRVVTRQINIKVWALLSLGYGFIRCFLIWLPHLKDIRGIDPDQILYYNMVGAIIVPIYRAQLNEIIENTDIVNSVCKIHFYAHKKFRYLSVIHINNIYRYIYT